MQVNKVFEDSKELIYYELDFLNFVRLFIVG